MSLLVSARSRYIISYTAPAGTVIGFDPLLSKVAGEAPVLCKYLISPCVAPLGKSSAVSVEKSRIIFANPLVAEVNTSFFFTFRVPTITSLLSAPIVIVSVTAPNIVRAVPVVPVFATIFPDNVKAPSIFKLPSFSIVTPVLP